jgi:hypothetical protein
LTDVDLSIVDHRGVARALASLGGRPVEQSRLQRVVLRHGRMDWDEKSDDIDALSALVAKAPVLTGFVLHNATPPIWQVPVQLREAFGSSALAHVVLQELTLEERDNIPGKLWRCHDFLTSVGTIPRLERISVTCGIADGDESPLEVEKSVADGLGACVCTNLHLKILDLDPDLCAAAAAYDTLFASLRNSTTLTELNLGSVDLTADWFTNIATVINGAPFFRICTFLSVRFGVTGVGVDGRC